MRVKKAMQCSIHAMMGIARSKVIFVARKPAVSFNACVWCFVKLCVKVSWLNESGYSVLSRHSCSKMLWLLGFLECLGSVVAFRYNYTSNPMIAVIRCKFDFLACTQTYTKQMKWNNSTRVCLHSRTYTSNDKCRRKAYSEYFEKVIREHLLLSAGEAADLHEESF